MEYSHGTQNLSITMPEADQDLPWFFYYQYIAWKQELETVWKLRVHNTTLPKDLSSAPNSCTGAF